MSLINDLLLLKFVNQLKPGKFIIILAIIYLFFIFRSSILAELILASILISIVFLCSWAIHKDKEEAKKHSWSDEPSVKAYMEQWRADKAPKRKDNPYE